MENEEWDRQWVVDSGEKKWTMENGDRHVKGLTPEKYFFFIDNFPPDN